MCLLAIQRHPIKIVPEQKRHADPGSTVLAGAVSLPKSVSVIAIIDKREMFLVVRNTTFQSPAVIDEMSLAEKLDKIRSPKLQNQREV